MRLLTFLAACLLLTAVARASSLSAQEAAINDLFGNDVGKPVRPAGKKDPVIQFDNKTVNLTGNPVEVQVGMYILDIEIDDVDQEYTITLFLRQFWQDDRLKFSKKYPDVEHILLNEPPKKMWLPDTFFVNERKGRTHDVTTKNSFVKITKDGNVTYSVRYTLKLACPMSLYRFPLDEHVCDTEFESFGYTMNELVLKWRDEPSQALSLQFSLSPKSFHIVNYGYGHRNRLLTTGTYGSLLVEFLFARSSGLAVLQVVLPLGTVMLLSYLMLVCNARRGIRLLIAVFLFLIVLLAVPFVIQLGPKTNIPTALDWWAICCSFFTALPALIIGCAALIEARYGAVNKTREESAGDGNTTMELLSPPTEEGNGAGSSAAGVKNAARSTPRGLLARFGITGDKIERWMGIFAFILVVIVMVIYAIRYCNHEPCHKCLSTYNKFDHPNFIY